ncbi:hypothetical protein [Streptomyces sp. NPDC007856]|uniref:hypothetical protein n=1 Tax=Streptomyces sp. NPDC007856 TaxID=3364781 RepID=UPI0036971AB5
MTSTADLAVSRPGTCAAPTVSAVSAVSTLSGSRNPCARTPPSPLSTFTLIPRGTSIRCRAEQSAMRPEQWNVHREAAPSMPVDPVP